MKTVGEIIHTERLKKDLTLEKLSFLTKIDIKYLDGLEKNNYSELPSETFIKGFIRNVALRLDKNPDELMAIFRRDYKQLEKSSPKVTSHQKIKLNQQTSRLLPYFFGLLIFLLYLGFQFRAVLTPPKLEIQTPTANSVVVSPFDVDGLTTVDSQITLGEDIRVRPDETGRFTAKLSLPIGETTLFIKSTNRFGRSTTQKIPLTVISK